VNPTRRQWLAASAAASLAGCATSNTSAPAEAAKLAFAADASPVMFSGQPAIVLRRILPEGHNTPAITEVEILTGRGFNIWQVRGFLPGKGTVDLFTAPSLEKARELMNGGMDDFYGNEGFKNGGALLIPYANRIRGKFLRLERRIETNIAGKPFKLPANWVGKNPGAEPHAMHGLMLDQAVTNTRREATAAGAFLDSHYGPTAFRGHWPASTELFFSAALDDKGFTVKVRAVNKGDVPLPMGIGWHPYLNLPSGDRKQARLQIPAASRALVDNYDNVFPTGAVEPTAGSKFDFRAARAMGDQFLDDCFFDLARNPDGSVSAEVHDPAAKYGIRATSQSQAVKAYQCYAPPDKPFIVLEPQYNLGDPFNTAIWKGRDTGIVTLAPGEETTYDATLSVFAV
jgi:aldose 1-epimerase